VSLIEERIRSANSVFNRKMQKSLDFGPESTQANMYNIIAK